MYKGRKVVALVPAHNEEAKIGLVVSRIDHTLVDSVMVIDDGSSDGTAAVAAARGAEVLSTGKRAGVGAALRMGIEYAHWCGYDLAVIMAGNNKDDPA